MGVGNAFELLMVSSGFGHKDPRYGITGYEVFKRDTKLEIFLPKNHHTVKSPVLTRLV